MAPELCQKYLRGRLHPGGEGGKALVTAAVIEAKLGTHGDVTLGESKKAFAQDAAVGKQLLKFPMSEQTHFVDDFVDDVGLYESPRRPAHDAMLQGARQVLNVRSEQVSFDGKAAGRRLNPESSCDASCFVGKSLLVIPGADVFYYRI